MDTTAMLARLQRMSDAMSVAEYRSWVATSPHMTALMVRSAKAREAAERRALVAYLRISDPRRRVV
jgi:hypothetical protein